MVQAIFFDVDGTLVSFRTHTVSPGVLDALHRLREKGIKLFISTGRHIQLIDDLCRLFPFDGFVTLSGQYCFCGDTVLRRNPLPPRETADLVRAAREMNFPCVFMEENEVYVNHVDEATRELLEELNIPCLNVHEPEHALSHTLYQAVVFLTEQEEDKLARFAPTVDHTRWHPAFLDAIPAGGGKDVGVDAILEHFHIPLENAMAFGDGANDLSMLTHVGLGVAMGNARDDVKAQADYVTDSVDEDGVVTALKHFHIL